jgi:hypothetical protein
VEQGGGPEPPDFAPIEMHAAAYARHVASDAARVTVKERIFRLDSRRDLGQYLGSPSGFPRAQLGQRVERGIDLVIEVLMSNPPPYQKLAEQHGGGMSAPTPIGAAYRQDR